MLAASWDRGGVAPKFRSARSMRTSLPPAADATAPVLMELAFGDCVVVTKSDAEVVVVVDVAVVDIEEVVSVAEGRGEGRGGERGGEGRGEEGRGGEKEQENSQIQNFLLPVQYVTRGSASIKSSHTHTTGPINLQLYLCHLRP